MGELACGFRDRIMLSPRSTAARRLIRLAVIAPESPFCLASSQLRNTRVVRLLPTPHRPFMHSVLGTVFPWWIT